MAKPKTDVMVIWLLLAAISVLMVVLLNQNRKAFLGIAGDRNTVGHEKALSDFLEMRNGYGRLLSRYHEGNLPESQAEIKGSADFARIIGRDLGGSREESLLRFVQSDALWMAGSDAEARQVLHKAFPQPPAR